MNENFFEKILRQNLRDESISDVKVKSQVPAVGEGENFLSKIWRFTVSYHCCDNKMFSGKEKLDSLVKKKEKEIKLIAKFEPENIGPRTELIKQQRIFETETKVFKIILPEMEKIIGRQLAPKCFYHFSATKEKQSFLVLEDLQPLGFRTKNRQKGLSLDHVLMVLENIAHFHAASVYQYERDPNLLKSFTDGIFSADRTPANMFRILEQTLRMVSEECLQWRDPIFKIISEKLNIIEKKFFKELIEATNYDDDEFCVLNHGDCWINNIMFREDDKGKPMEVMMIDFQMSVYSSPIIDLIYFLSVCPSIEIKVDNDGFFIGKYLEILKNKMSTLGCRTKPPTIENLYEAISKRRMWFVMAALTFYPRMIADPNELESFDEILESGETRMDIFKNLNATVALQKTLLFMEKEHYLD